MNLLGSVANPRTVIGYGEKTMPKHRSALFRAETRGGVRRACRYRRCPYLNSVLEQDHRFLKKRIAANLGFRSVEGGLNTIDIDADQAIHMIRKEPSRNNRRFLL